MLTYIYIYIIYLFVSPSRRDFFIKIITHEGKKEEQDPSTQGEREDRERKRESLGPGAKIREKSLKTEGEVGESSD